MQKNNNDSFPFSRFFIKVVFLVFLVLICFLLFIRDSNKKKQRVFYLYQYVKLETIKYSSWSAWETIGKVPCNQKQKFCLDDSFCLKEEKIWKKKDHFNLKEYKKNQVVIQKTARKERKVCKRGHYILFNNTLYQTKTDYSNIKNWKYQGRFAYQDPPKDTINTKYLYVNAEDRSCSDTCHGDLIYYFDQYYFPSLSLANSTCSNHITKRVDQYDYILTPIIYKRWEKEEIQCYQKIRTREISEESIFVWSHLHDQELLKNGYRYTGKKKIER